MRHDPALVVAPEPPLAPRRTVRRGFGFVVLIGALAMLPPLSIDVSLPGLPAIARGLHAPGGTVQWTLSAFIFALGSGQLVLGPLSDRWGRRPVLFGGLALFTLTAVGCALTSDVRALIALRFVQGFGACAGVVCARAIVRDVEDDRARAASLQAYVSAVVSVAPIVAPLAGAAVLSLLGWRWLYGILAVAGAALVTAVLFALPETSPRVASGIRAAYRRVLRLPRTVPLAGVVFCCFGAYFGLISASPFVLIAQLHISSTAFAFAFAINACALLCGSFLTARLGRAIGPERLFAVGITGTVTCGIVACVVDVTAPSVTGFVITMAAFAFCMGITLPNAYAAALHDAGSVAGLTSGILGAAQMIGGATGSAIAGALPFEPSIAIGVVVAGAGAAAAACYVASRLR